MSNKIQVRRGDSSDLPNPLDNGELGWCEDTRELYIGTGVENSNLKVAGAAVTADFAVYCATAALGGRAASQGADGPELAAGVTTATSAGKLVNGNADFTSELVGRTVYNSTDDTWAKVTAVDSPTELSLSADIMAGGEDYVVADALDTVAEAFAAVPGPYSANVTVRVSPGTFPEDITFVGKTASGNKTLVVRGSTTGTTTVSGRVIHRQKLTVRDITFTERISAYFGADLEWYDCMMSGASKLYIYSGSANYLEGSTATVGNDPTGITAVNSTVNKGYTIYVASTALGGDDATADGLAVTSGTATATSAGKLVDSSANFASGLAGLALYNPTDDTWAKVTAVDSPTELSLSADIMASGEEYLVASAFSTIQAAVDLIPGTVNCDTDIKVSGGTFSEDTELWGKSFSGAYTISIKGTTNTVDSGTSTGSNGVVTINDTGKSWTTGAYVEKWVEITGGTGAGQIRLIKSNTGTQLTVHRKWVTTPDNTSTYRVYDLLTDGMTFQIDKGQKGVKLYDLSIDKPGGTFNVFAQNGAEAILYQCIMTGAVDSPLRSVAFTQLKVNESVAHSTGARGFLISRGAYGLLWGSVVRDIPNHGVELTTGGKGQIWEGTEIRDNGGQGVKCDLNSAVLSIGASAPGRQVSYTGNTLWGVQSIGGGQVTGLSYAAFSGNGNGSYTGDATTYGYAG